jgi:hypothetical protein
MSFVSHVNPTDFERLSNSRQKGLRDAIAVDQLPEKGRIGSTDANDDGKAI